MASKSTYTQHYSNFVGADMSSDPRAVSRNRLSHCVNMWRDYESEQGAAVETFPGFRTVAPLAAKTHGMYHFRSKDGKDYVVVHAGNDLYAFETESLADGDYNESSTPILNGALADSDSTGFLFNNNLYILDGEHFIVVSDAASGSATSITADEIEGYIPTTYFNGEPYEQRNMLSKYAYEVVTQGEVKSAGIIDYEYSNVISNDRYIPSRHIVKGITEKGTLADYLVISAPNCEVEIVERAFEGLNGLLTVDIVCRGRVIINANAFADCENLNNIRVCIYPDNISGASHLDITKSFVENCDVFNQLTIYCKFDTLYQNIDSELEEGKVEFIEYETTPFIEYRAQFDKAANVSELAEGVVEVKSYNKDEPIPNYSVIYDKQTVGEEELRIVKYVLVNDKDFVGGVKLKLKLHSNHFSTIENAKNFYDGNPDYKQTGVEAINGCTKSAVFDGRIFLTGNQSLPNTVFYSHRNLTGANDPTYFGAYNYFNDGVGNTPNVELLSTPSMLMVLKNDTVQDGSVYYHVGADNTDEYSKNLLPRIYPATTGAAGLGSAGAIGGGVTCCNFLDDPVFLSKRGLEAVGKQTVNLERTLTHRSSNVDRLLIKENLENASMAEWKGYLVICCKGNMYLADSRYISQHSDGSYQYEWYYLEGLGTYKKYSPRYRYLTDWMDIGDCTHGEETIKNKFKLRDIRYIQRYGDLDPSTVIMQEEKDESFTVYYVEEDGAKYLVQQVDGEQYGEPYIYEDDKKVENFCPAVKVLSIGGRLYFGTTNGDVCCVNTDMRDPNTSRIGRDHYTFNGVAYESGCATRLDDCDKKAVSKATVCGTTIAAMKTMEGAKFNVNISLNGRDWQSLCRGRGVGSSFFDFGNFDFSNFSFTETETNFVNLPELTRNWINKQYYFYSDGFKEPFGLYELSYIYYVKGKIRRM